MRQVIEIETLPELGPLYRPVEYSGAAVLILHGSEGPGAGWSHRFAAILAAHGLAALPYGYGTGDVWGAGEIREVDISGIAQAGDALAAHPAVTKAHLLGWSRGGELAMHLAAIAGADLSFDRVAAHAPADVCVQAFDVASYRDGKDRGRMALPARAWVWPGQNKKLEPGREIEIERFPRPVFLSVGTADEIWDHRMTLRLADRLTAAGNPPELWVAEGQGHAFDFETEPQFWARLLAFFSAG